MTVAVLRSGSPSRPSPDVMGLRDAIDRHRAVLIERLGAGEDGIALGRVNARFLEACFKSRFEGATRQAELPSGAALAAVGSFGRGAVALHSDADVVMLVDPRRVSGQQASVLVESLLYPLWDGKLAVGHQVLSAADAVSLARTDLATATALLDLRWLAGDRELLVDLVTRAREGLFGEGDLGIFIDRLEAEAGGRHQRFGDSPYLLEPDVKAGAGGLRDLDGARWAALARYRMGEGDPESKLGAWGELVRLGVLVSREAQEVAASEEFLWRVRNRLHARSARKADRLYFDDQESIAVALGYGDDRVRAAQRLMQLYYRHARAVTHARSSFFERLRPPRRHGKPPARVDLGGGVHLFDGQVTVAGTAELQQDPTMAMRVFATCVRRHAPMLPFARDAIARVTIDLAWCEKLRASREACELFVDLTCSVHAAQTARGSILEELHDVGVLLAMVPEFLPVIGRVHHDVYHVYTVDGHSIAAVDRLRQLARGELAREYPLASRLAAEIARPRPLFLATLLHDIGKGWPDAAGSRKDHSKVGAELCDRILPKLGLGVEEVAEARQLVFDHLIMYAVATRRDLDDAATIADFCHRLGGRDRLRSLYLLTVADVSTTSPTALTSWKARMLDELYFAADAYLAGHETPADAARSARVREEVRAAWSGPLEPLDALLSALPERYLLTNRAESIALHAVAVVERGARSAHVARVASRYPEAAELCVVADDRPGLLEGVAAALTASRLEVLAAEVYSHPVGAEREALDLFWVRDRDGGTDGIDEVLPRLAQDLQDVCAGRVAPADLLRARTGSVSRWSERPSPAVPTEIFFDDRASPRHTVIEVYAKDRRGLLYSLARALHEAGLSISLSKISTEGMRVADVFYVSELDGSKVAPGLRRSAIKDAIVRAAER